MKKGAQVNSKISSIEKYLEEIDECRDTMLELREHTRPGSNGIAFLLVKNDVPRLIEIIRTMLIDTAPYALDQANTIAQRGLGE